MKMIWVMRDGLCETAVIVDDDAAAQVAKDFEEAAQQIGAECFIIAPVNV